MDELFISRLRIISNYDKEGNSIAKELQQHIKLNKMSDFMASLNPDTKKKPEQNENTELCKIFLQYYRLLLSQCMHYSEVADVVNYIKNKHQNVMTTAHSIINDKSMNREIYLTLDEIEDMHIFIDWFEDNFKQTEEKDEGEYT